MAAHGTIISMFDSRIFYSETFDKWRLILQVRCVMMCVNKKSALMFREMFGKPDASL